MLTAGHVLSQTLELYRRELRALVLTTLAFWAVVVVIVTLFLMITQYLVAQTLQTASSLAAALIATIVGYALIALVLSIIVTTYTGGQYHMLIRASQEQRPARFNDIFEGLGHVRAYATLSLILAGLSAAYWAALIGGAAIHIAVMVLALIGVGVVTVWLSVNWLYVVPAIADTGVGFAEAARRSRKLVRAVGLGRTFLLMVILGLIDAAAVIVLSLLNAAVDAAVAGASPTVVGLVTFAVFTPLVLLLTPFDVCYLTTMYRISSGVAPARPRSAARPAPSRRPPAAARAGYFSYCVSCGTPSDGGTFCRRCGDSLARR